MIEDDDKTLVKYDCYVDECASFRSDSSDNDDDPPEVKAEKDKERRQANNARERFVATFFFCQTQGDVSTHVHL